VGCDYRKATGAARQVLAVKARRYDDTVQPAPCFAETGMGASQQSSKVLILGELVADPIEAVNASGRATVGTLSTNAQPDASAIWSARQATDFCSLIFGWPIFFTTGSVAFPRHFGRPTGPHGK
jgi:hypothetical protein